MINRIRHDRRAVGGEEVVSVISVGSKVTTVSVLSLMLGFGFTAGLLEAQTINPPGGEGNPKRPEGRSRCPALADVPGASNLAPKLLRQFNATACPEEPDLSHFTKVKI